MFLPEIKSYYMYIILIFAYQNRFLVARLKSSQRGCEYSQKHNALRVTSPIAIVTLNRCRELQSLVRNAEDEASPDYCMAISVPCFKTSNKIVKKIHIKSIAEDEACTKYSEICRTTLSCSPSQFGTLYSACVSEFLPRLTVSVINCCQTITSSSNCTSCFGYTNFNLWRSHFLHSTPNINSQRGQYENLC